MSPHTTHERPDACSAQHDVHGVQFIGGKSRKRLACERVKQSRGAEERRVKELKTGKEVDVARETQFCFFFFFFSVSVSVSLSLSPQNTWKLKRKIICNEERRSRKKGVFLFFEEK